MRKIEYYVAKDGTKFEDEYECECYELSKDGNFDKFTFLDKNGEPLVADEHTDYEYLYQDTYYFKTPDISQEELDETIANLTTLGFYTDVIQNEDEVKPNSLYCYNDDFDSWINIDIALDKLLGYKNTILQYGK